MRGVRHGSVDCSFALRGNRWEAKAFVVVCWCPDAVLGSVCGAANSVCADRLEVAARVELPGVARAIGFSI